MTADAERAVLLYGTDVSTYAGVDGDDVEPMLGLMTGARVVAEAVARRLETRRGSLLGHPDEGLDLSMLRSARMTQAQARLLQREIEREVLRDERVSTAEVRVVMTDAAQLLEIEVAGQCGLGPFGLVLRLDGDEAIATIMEG